VFAPIEEDVQKPFGFQVLKLLFYQEFIIQNKSVQKN
jgi:hypothetical protein